MGVELHALHPHTADFEGAVAVYAEYVGSTVEAHRAFFLSHAQRRDYVGIVAKVGPQVVGVAFGEASLPGQWWHDVVARHVGASHPALQEAWVLTQLNVLQAYRDRGIGGDLHDAIIDRQPYHHVLLSTQQRNLAAQRFYKRRGWFVLHPGIVFSQGDEPYMIMRKTRV